MASITIRRLDDKLKVKLRVQAATHGRSMEQEAREILKAGLSGKISPAPNLADSIRRRVTPIGGVELSLPGRQAVRRPPKIAE